MDLAKYRMKNISKMNCQKIITKKYSR